jgi:hypothetical protein
MSNITLTENQSLVSKELNEQVMVALSSTAQGFERAFVMASAISLIKGEINNRIYAAYNGVARL